MNSRAGSRAAISSSRSGRVRLRGLATSSITRRPSTLGPGPEASLDVFDPGVEHGNVLSERGEVALENIAPNPLVGQHGLDTPKRLGDGVVLLLEAFQAPIDLVEVTEELCAKFIESLIDGVEALIDGLEEPIDGLETLAEEQDKLLVLRRRHASISTLPGPKLQVCRVVDSRTGPCESLQLASASLTPLRARRYPARHGLDQPAVPGRDRLARGTSRRPDAARAGMHDDPPPSA